MVEITEMFDEDGRLVEVSVLNREPMWLKSSPRADTGVAFAVSVLNREPMWLKSPDPRSVHGVDRGFSAQP